MDERNAEEIGINRKETWKIDMFSSKTGKFKRFTENQRKKPRNARQTRESESTAKR